MRLRIGIDTMVDTNVCLVLSYSLFVRVHANKMNVRLSDAALVLILSDHTHRIIWRV